MHKIELDSLKIVYVSEKQPDRNFYNEFPVYLENNALTNDRKDALLKFDLSKINKKDIKQMVLCIPMCKWEEQNTLKNIEIDVYKNLSSYKCQTVTWNTRPGSRFFKKTMISPDFLCDKMIQIDITQLLKEWLCSANNNGITLSFPILGSRLSICNDIENNPFLKVFICESCQSEEHAAMQIQADCFGEAAIDVGQALPFNTLISSNQSYFTFIKNKSEIIVHKKGYYNIQWTVAITSAGDVPEVNITLMNTGNGEVVQSSIPVNLPGQLTGSALIECREPDQAFRLINNSSGFIKLANTTIQATLNMTKI